MLNNEILAFVLKRYTIPESALKKVPSLKNCDNWKLVHPLGLVDHKTKMAYYRGALVELDGKLYFISKEMIAVLHQDRKWQFPRVIQVIKDT